MKVWLWRLWIDGWNISAHQRTAKRDQEEADASRGGRETLNREQITHRVVVIHRRIAGTVDHADQAAQFVVDVLGLGPQTSLAQAWDHGRLLQGLRQVLAAVPG